MDNIVTNLDDMVANDMKRMVANIDSITSVINANTEEIDKTLDGFASLGEAMEDADMKEVFAKIRTTVANADSIVTKINTGQGSAGKLINDPELYHNLASASEELDQLLKDLKNNPERYVHFSLFGRKNKPYTAPEK